MVLVAKKQFGQHFLINRHIASFLASRVDRPSAVIEIGPGTGNLTSALLENDNVLKVLAFEKDSSLLEDLRIKFSHYEERFVLYEEDAELINVPNLVQGLGPNSKSLMLIANLPYNVGTTILLNFVYHIASFSKLTVMLQSEVVDRLTAKFGCKDYGKISVLSQSQCHVREIMKIGPNNFHPRQKVDSSIVEFVPKENLLTTEEYKVLLNFASVILRFRRKTLANNLKNSVYDQFVDKISSYVSLQSRSEDLTVDAIVGLVKAMLEWGLRI